jgi:GR25 family glycosyltransferase involved in LPS biosynthesis
LPLDEKITVLIMNLERDTERLTHIMRQFQELSGFEVQIVKGIAGETLPDSVYLALTDGEQGPARKGTLGCFLSHVRAWETVAKMQGNFAVVLEDDVNIIDLDAIRGLRIPADAEFIFINERMSARWHNADFTVVGMPDVLLCLDASRRNLGGDGYVLTPSGARKLLAACQTDLYSGHVDGRLLRYVTSAGDVENLPPESWTKKVISHHHNKRRMPELGLLRGYSVSKPLVQQRGIASSRERADAAPE